MIYIYPEGGLGRGAVQVGRVDVAEILGLVDDAGVGGVTIVEVETEVDGFLTLTRSLDKVSCFFNDCFLFSAGPWYC